jgi:hypothetical protein
MNREVHAGQLVPPCDKMKDRVVYTMVWATAFCWLPDCGAVWAAPVTPATGTRIAIASSAAGQLGEPHP